MYQKEPYVLLIFIFIHDSYLNQKAVTDKLKRYKIEEHKVHESQYISQFGKFGTILTK